MGKMNIRLITCQFNKSRNLRHERTPVVHNDSCPKHQGPFRQRSLASFPVNRPSSHYIQPSRKKRNPPSRCNLHQSIQYTLNSHIRTRATEYASYSRTPRKAHRVSIELLATIATRSPFLTPMVRIAAAKSATRALSCFHVRLQVPDAPSRTSMIAIFESSL